MVGRVSVIGLGYIGLPTALLLASNGMLVTGIDSNKRRVDALAAGECYLQDEEGFSVLLKNCLERESLSISSTIVEADFYIIAVPTPLTDNGLCDLSMVFDVVESIADILKLGDTIILESTSPVGTVGRIKDFVEERRPDLRNSPEVNFQYLHYAYCPERAIPGNTLTEVVHNSRLIGGISENCAKKAEGLYRTFVEGPIATTDAPTAELVKLTENASRDVQLAFANELSMVCDQLDLDVWKVIEFANLHPRVSILRPGPGVGGHCIAVDPHFIIQSAPNLTKLIQCARNVNKNKTDWVKQKISSIVEELFEHSYDAVTNKITVALLGLTFKKNVSDLRESPSLELAIQLSKFDRVRLLIVDPYIKNIPQEIIGGPELTSLESAVQSADLAIILTDHDYFQEKIEIVKKFSKIFDTRGLLT